MRILFLIMFFIFSYANSDYLKCEGLSPKIYNQLKLIDINNELVVLIKDIKNNKKLYNKLDLMNLDEINSFNNLINIYISNNVQKYFNYLKKDVNPAILVINKNVLNGVSNIQIIDDLIKEDNKVKNKKVSDIKSIKALYRLVISAVDAEAYIIKTYNISPKFILVHKGDKKAYILDSLVEIKKNLAKNSVLKR